MAIARLENGQIAERRDVDILSIPAHKAAALGWKTLIVAGEGDQVSVSSDETTITETRSLSKNELVRYAASKRWTIQSGGITLNGAQIDTSTDSLALITGAIESLERGWTTAPIRFKAKNAWLDLSLVDLQGAAAAVSQHVQNCFSAEAAVVTKINNDTYTTVAAVNGASEWPA